MTSSKQPSGILGRFQLLKNKASAGLVDIAKVVEEKLEKTQEVLEKQRLQAAAAATATAKPNTEEQKIWRKSDDNPNGEIIIVPKPPPSPISTDPISIPIPSPTEIEATSAPIPTVTIAHTRRGRSRRDRVVTLSFMTDSGNDSGVEQTSHSKREEKDRQIVQQFLNDLINDVVIRDDVHQSLEHLIDIISTMDQLLDETVVLSTSIPEELIVEPDESVSDIENPLEESTEDDVESIAVDVAVEPTWNDGPSTEEVSEPHSPERIETPPVEDFDQESVPMEKVATSSCSDSDADDVFMLPKVTTETRQSPPAVESPPEHHVLTDLRDLISRIEDDSTSDDDDVFYTTTSTNNMSIVTDKLIIEVEEELPISTETLKEKISEPSSVDPSLSFLSSSDSSTTSVVDNDIPIAQEVPVAVPVPRFSVVNCHSIPTGVRVNSITCSSTYLYLCATDRKIYYAKLHLNSLDLPLKWQCHADSADRLAVDPSNQTVWRLYNKRLYISQDASKHPPLGQQWSEIKLEPGRSVQSMFVNDQCCWYIKDDGSLWLHRHDDQQQTPINVMCPFELNAIVGFAEKMAVATSDGHILVRVGCTEDCLEGDGWVFIKHTFIPFDDFLLLTNQNVIGVIDRKHRLWIHQWSSSEGFFEVLCNDESPQYQSQHLTCANNELLCLTDSQDQVYLFSDSITGVEWTLVEKSTRLQRLIGAFSGQDYVWALNTDRTVCASNGRVLEKPRQAQYLTHASFAPNEICEGTIFWTLDESCNIYIRDDVEPSTQWRQLDQIQFEWSRRIVHMVCGSNGVWAVDDRGCVYFRHGHSCSSSRADMTDESSLPPAWISVPGVPKRSRTFSQIYCGPADWMVYATDNKQTVYVRIGITEGNRVGTSWEMIEDCSALELSISEHRLWLLTSFGSIQCRENISQSNPIGTRSTTLPGFFFSLIVSMDDRQVWALDSKRNLLKLNRLTILFEK